MTPRTDAKLARSTRSWLALILLLTAALSLVWSHFRLMEQDEFLSFYTDSVPTLKQVVLVQLHYPISLDPPTYHLLSHLCMDVFGRNAMALRLPALGGFLLFQLCGFFFVRRMAGDRSALIAAALPVLTASFFYSVQGRPYGLLLGLYALALLCWQIAADLSADGTPHSRLLPLSGLTLAIALAITSHYFGVLILIPVAIGELARTVIRRRLDAGMIAALAVGLASIVLILPFKRALMVYRVHYYITGVVVRDISQGYRELFLRYTTWPMPLQRLAAVAMVVLALWLAVAGYRRFQRRPVDEPAWLWAALAAMALLPFFGYLLGCFVTHTMEVRYVIAAITAFVATFAILLEDRLHRDSAFYAVFCGLILAVLVVNTSNILHERRVTRETVASMTASSGLSAALHSGHVRHVYEQSLAAFFADSYYTPDPKLRSRITLLYSAQREISLLGHDTNALTALNLQQFSRLPIVDYDQLRSEPEQHLMVQFTGGWEWESSALVVEDANIQPLGHSFGGEAVCVQWPQAQR